MLRLIPLVLLIIMSGCTKAQRIDRATLDQRYQETQLSEGAVSIMPLRLDPDAKPPTVVNWWYVGSSSDVHHLVYREVTWGAARKPVGKEIRYRIARDQLAIDQPFAITDNEARWLPLYEVAPSHVQPPADLPTTRKPPGPVPADPIALPSQRGVPVQE